MAEVSFAVHGAPAPQGSKRHVGNGVMIESSKKVRPWRQDVRAAAEKALAEHPAIALTSAPVAVEVSFYLPRAKGHYRTGRNAHLLRADAPARPSGRPDADKLARAVLDALTAVVWLDDAQVVTLTAHKFYAELGVMRGATVTIREI